MAKGAIPIGILFVLFGSFLLLVTNFNPVGLIYGIIAIILGIALIAFHKEEDIIEQRKDLKPKKHKK